MTDINKVRDDLAKKFVDSEICFGSLEYPLSGKTNQECVKSFKAGFDAAIAHLSKQSVEFDEDKVYDANVQFEKQPMAFRHAAFIDGARWQHQHTALIYEARLALAVEACRG